MQNHNFKKDKKSTIALIKQVTGTGKQDLSLTLEQFFDAASFTSYETSLATLIQDYFIHSGESDLSIASMVHQIRLINNLLLELSQLHIEQVLLSNHKKL